jgi:hypothetical protein
MTMTLEMWDQLLEEDPANLATRGAYHDWLLERECELEAGAQRAIFEGRFVILKDPRNLIRPEAVWDLWCASYDPACQHLWRHNLLPARDRNYYRAMRDDKSEIVREYVGLLDRLVFSKFKVASRYSYPTRLAAEQDLVRALARLQEELKESQEGGDS